MHQRATCGRRAGCCTWGWTCPPTTRIEGAVTDRSLYSTQLPIVLWNQRWEYDKNPSAFFRVMNRLDDAGVPFRLILAGKHFHEQPEEFEQAFERYAERILHYGYAEDFAEYSRLLHRAT